MKKKVSMIVLAVMVMALVLMMAGCPAPSEPTPDPQPTPTPDPTPEVDPMELLAEMFEKVDKNNYRVDDTQDENQLLAWPNIQIDAAIDGDVRYYRSTTGSGEYSYTSEIYVDFSEIGKVVYYEKDDNAAWSKREAPAEEHFSLEFEKLINLMKVENFTYDEETESYILKEEKRNGIFEYCEIATATIRLEGEDIVFYIERAMIVDGYDAGKVINNMRLYDFGKVELTLPEIAD